jgi:hypothetical protein
VGIFVGAQVGERDGLPVGIFEGALLVVGKNIVGFKVGLLLLAGSKQL